MWATTNRLTIDVQTILSIPHTVFVKPLVKIQNLSAGWITSAGLTVEVDSAHLARWPFIVLEGEAPYEALGGEPVARAAPIDAKLRSGKELPTRLRRIGSSYQVVIDARELSSQNSSTTKIVLVFDRFFVPSRLGISADNRELVVAAPRTHELAALEPNDGLLRRKQFHFNDMKQPYLMLENPAAAIQRCRS